MAMEVMILRGGMMRKLRVFLWGYRQLRRRFGLLFRRMARDGVLLMLGRRLRQNVLGIEAPEQVLRRDRRRLRNRGPGTR